MGWLKAHWVAVAVGAVVFFVGVGIGAGGSSGTDEGTNPATVTVNDSETVSETVTETLDPTEEQVEALDDRATALVERAAKLRERERKVAARERKVRRAEQVVARSTFGDGTYLVGKDVPAGSYVARGGSDCYWERRRQGGSGLDAIIENYIGSGQARVTIYAGELFNSQRCGTWRRG